MLLRQIEIMPQIEEFYSQFSECLRGEDLLEPVDATAATPGPAFFELTVCGTLPRVVDWVSRGRNMSTGA